MFPLPILESEPANIPHGIKINLDRERLVETVEQLKRSPVGLDPFLGKCVLNGVAYHHAGIDVYVLHYCELCFCVTKASNMTSHFSCLLCLFSELFFFEHHFSHFVSLVVIS